MSLHATIDDIAQIAINIKPSLKTIYVDSTGNDNNDGSYKSPIATLSKLATIQSTLGANEYLNAFLKRGNVYREQFNLTKGGRDTILKTYIGSYGDASVAPIIDGSLDLSTLTWVNTGSNIWKATLATPIKALWVAGVRKQLARNSTIYNIDSFDGTTGYIQSSALVGQADDRYNGAFIDTKYYAYVPVRLLITDFVGSTGRLYYNKIFGNAPANINFDFVIDNLLEFLTVDGQWYYDTNAQQICYKSSVNPNTLNIVGSTKAYGIYQGTTGIYDGNSTTGIKNVTIENIDFRYQSSDALRFSGLVQNLTLNNLNITDCKRGGIAIEGTPDINVANNTGHIITNNTIVNCGSVGIAASRVSYSNISNNTLSSIGTSNEFYGFEEVFNTGYGDLGNAISLPTFTDKPDSYNTIVDNKIVGCSKSGIFLAGTNSVISRNTVAGFAAVGDDVGGVYLWGSYTSNNYIGYNYIKDPIKSIIYTTSTDTRAVGIYFDNYSHDNVAYKNTVLNCDQGFEINNDTYNNSIISNNIGGCTQGIYIYNTTGSYALNVAIKENNIVVTKSNHVPIYYQGIFNYSTESYQRGIIDKNNYYLVGQGFFVLDVTNIDYDVSTALPISRWRELTGFDQKSNVYNLIDETAEKTTATVVESALLNPSFYNFSSNTTDGLSYPLAQTYGSASFSIITSGGLDGNTVKISTSDTTGAVSSWTAMSFTAITTGSWYRIKFSTKASIEHYIKLVLAASDNTTYYTIQKVYTGPTRTDHEIYYQHVGANIAIGGGGNDYPHLEFRVTGYASIPIDVFIDNLVVDKVSVNTGHKIQDTLVAKVNTTKIKQATYVSGKEYGEIATSIVLEPLEGILQFSTDSGTYITSGKLPSKIANPRIQALTSSAIVIPNADTDDLITITAQAVGLFIANPAGVPVQGQSILIRIKDNATSRSISYGSQYRALGITLPVTTVISKTVYLGMIYNATDRKWDIVGVSQEA